MTGTVMRPAAVNQQLSASFVNSFKMATVADRLALHFQPGQDSDPTEFFRLCLSLAKGIDYAVANNEVPARAQDLPQLLKKVCQRRNDLFLQASTMVLMVSVKNACKKGWFSDKESQELLTLANEIANNYCSPGDINGGSSNVASIITTVMSRFYPLMKMGPILASLEVKPGYGAYVLDFDISKNTTYCPQEKIRLFVAQTDNTDTSACIISPQQVNFLLNGKGVDRRTNVLMDTGPQMPTNVTAILKYGTNLLQAVGQFNGHYFIAIAFMSVVPLMNTPVLPDYVQSDVASGDPDSDIIEGPSRISLNCPISYRRIRIPVKGHSCKHLQCFDFSNYIDINSRRPSWRCPHCNQHVCYTSIRVDQNMIKVLKEVGENVNEVIISADGSWKAVLESDDDMDQTHVRTFAEQKEGFENQESAVSSVAHPITVDLTGDDDKMDTSYTIEIEDRKPFQTTLQSQSLLSQLNTATAVNQNATTQIDDGFWSGLHFSHGSGVSDVGAAPQIDNASANLMTSPLTTDAIIPALNHEGASMTSLMQNQISASGNVPLQNAISNEYARMSQVPMNISRSPIAIQALPAQPQTPTIQQRPRTNLNTSTGSSCTPPATISMNPRLVSDVSPFHQRPAAQNWNHLPSQSVQRQVASLPTSNQLSGSYRVPQNLHQQQHLRMPQSRSQSTGGLPSSSLPQIQTQPGSAQVGISSTAAPPNSRRSRYMGTQLPTQMGRQPPSVPVQIPTSRVPLFQTNTDRTRAPSVDQRGNAGGDGLMDLPSEENWQPTGRMRGSLSGRTYAALRELMIEPTQPGQAQRSPSNLSSTPPSIPPHLQALFANSRNAHVPQNGSMTGPGSVNGNNGAPPRL